MNITSPATNIAAVSSAAHGVMDRQPPHGLRDNIQTRA
jgi:hypothetical protein